MPPESVTTSLATASGNENPNSHSAESFRIGREEETESFRGAVRHGFGEFESVAQTKFFDALWGSGMRWKNNGHLCGKRRQPSRILRKLRDINVGGAMAESTERTDDVRRGAIGR